MGDWHRNHRHWCIWLCVLSRFAATFSRIWRMVIEEQMANGYHQSLMTACISQLPIGTPKRNTGPFQLRGMFWKRASLRTKRKSTWSSIKQVPRPCGVAIVEMKMRLGSLYLRKPMPKLMAITTRWMVDGQGVYIYRSFISFLEICSKSLSSLTSFELQRGPRRSHGWGHNGTTNIWHIERRRVLERGFEKCQKEVPI